jgi:hypothetical protein
LKGYCEYGDELSGFIKCGEFLDIAEEDGPPQMELFLKS